MVSPTAVCWVALQVTGARLFGGCLVRALFGLLSAVVTLRTQRLQRAAEQHRVAAMWGDVVRHRGGD